MNLHLRFYAFLFLFAIKESLSAQWTQMLPFTYQATFIGCSVIDSNNIFILSSNSFSKTTNGGISWSANNFQQGGTLISATLASDAYFPDQQTGIVVGLFGQGLEQRIYKTTDGGADWNNVYWDDSDTVNINRLHDLFFLNASLGWAVGSGGNILKTTDGGDNWQKQTPPTTHHIRSVHFLSANEGFASGDSVFLKTLDGGSNWSVSPIHYAPTRIFFLDSNTGFMGRDNYFLMTTDGGDSWNQVEQIDFDIDDFRNFRDIQFVNNTTGYLLTDRTIFKTKNRGLSWEYLTFGSTTRFRKFHWQNEDVGVAVGMNGVRWKITNGADVGYKPLVKFQINGTTYNVCHGKDYILNNLTPDDPSYSYEWYLDGNLFSTERDPIVNFPDPGISYVLKLIVNNGMLNASFEETIQVAQVYDYNIESYFSNTLTERCVGDLTYVTSSALPTDVQGYKIRYSFTVNDSIVYLQVNPTKVNTNFYMGSDTVACRLNAMVISPCKDTTYFEATKLFTPLPTVLSIDMNMSAQIYCHDEPVIAYLNNSIPGMTYEAFEQVQIGNGGTISFVIENYVNTIHTNYQELCPRSFPVQLSYDVVEPIAFTEGIYHYAIEAQPYQFLEEPLFNPYEYEWFFGPNATPNYSTYPTPTVVFDEEGQYQILQIVSDSMVGCPDTIQATVEVYPANSDLELIAERCLDVPTPMLYQASENDVITDMAVGDDGYIYATGYREEVSGPRTYNLVIYKFDQDGQLVWSKLTHHQDHENFFDFRHFVGTNISADSLGNIYLGGTFYCKRLYFNGIKIFEYPSNSSLPIPGGYIAKLDADGNMLWFDWFTSIYEYDRTVGPTEIIRVDDENIYALLKGNLVKYHDHTVGTTTIINYADINLVKLNAAGEILLVKEIANSVLNTLPGYLEMNKNGYSNSTSTAVGSRMGLTADQSVLILFDCGNSNLILQGIEYDQVPYGSCFAVKTDLNGNIQQVQIVHESLSNGFVFAGMDALGNIYQSLNFDYYKDSFYDPSEELNILGQIQEGNTGNYLFKYTPSGQLLWSIHNAQVDIKHFVVSPTGTITALVSHSQFLGLKDAFGNRYGYEQLENFTWNPNYYDNKQDKTNLSLVTWDANGNFMGAQSFSSELIDVPHTIASSNDCGDVHLLYSTNLTNNYSDTNYIWLTSVSQDGPCSASCQSAIVLQPSDINFCNSEGGSFRVEAVGDNLHYQWQSNANGSFTNLTNSQSYQGVNQPELVFHPSNSQLNSFSQIQFRCVITDMDGNEIISDAVNATPEILVISQYSSFIELQIGQEAILSVETNNDSIQKTWQVWRFGSWRDLASTSIPFTVSTDSDNLLLPYNSLGVAGLRIRCLLTSSTGCTTATSQVIVKRKIEQQIPQPSPNQDPNMIVISNGQYLEHPISGSAKLESGLTVLYPNPVVDALKIIPSIEHSDLVSWKLFDGMGRMLQSGSSLNGIEFIINAGHLQTGVFYLELVSMMKTETRIFVKQ